MTGVFADTYYFLALLNASDSAHAKAMAFSAAHRVPLITTTWVLTELADALCRAPHRRAFVSILRDLQTDPATEIVPASQGLFERALDLYTRRPDKDWSLTDCVSFVVMEDYGLTEALTGDHHFEQAGFRAILK